jgi:hypothetical protein
MPATALDLTTIADAFGMAPCLLLARTNCPD